MQLIAVQMKQKKMLSVWNGDQLCWLSITVPEKLETAMAFINFATFLFLQSKYLRQFPDPI